MKDCTANGCHRYPTMGTLCVTHWYHAKGKTPPENDPVKQSFDDSIKAGEGKRADIIAVDQAADPVWKTNAKRAVFDLASTRTTFTTDDVWNLLQKRNEEAPREPRALGAIMTAAASKQIIRASANYVESTRPECHRRPIRVWQSLIAKGEQ